MAVHSYNHGLDHTWMSVFFTHSLNKYMKPCQTHYLGDVRCVTFPISDGKTNHMLKANHKLIRPLMERGLYSSRSQ